jgi:Phosphorylated adapter RNA export protein, RNA-binding domain
MTMSSDETVKTIADALGEADEVPRAQIKAVVEALGEELSLAMLAETERIEKAGGMERGDGKGRRSPGGVYFYLARQKLSKEVRVAIFNDKMPRAPRPPGWEPPPPQAKKDKAAPPGGFPRRRVFEVVPTKERPARQPQGQPKSNWTPPAAPAGAYMPPELPNAVSRSKAKQGVLDALGSLHPDDQYLVLLDLLGDLHAIYGAEHAMPESKPSPVVPAPPPEPPTIARAEAAPVPEAPPKSTRKGTAGKSRR